MLLVEPRLAHVHGLTFLVNRPEWGGLFTELDATGRSHSPDGHLRQIGPATDRDLHMAMNIGIPLVNPTADSFSSFRPLFRCSGSTAAKDGWYSSAISKAPNSTPAFWRSRPSGRSGRGLQTGGSAAGAGGRPRPRSGSGSPRGAVHLRLRPRGREDADDAVSRGRRLSPTSLFFTRKVVCSWHRAGMNSR